MSLILSILSIIVGVLVILIAIGGIYSVFIRDAEYTPFGNLLFGGIACLIAYFVSAPFKAAFEADKMTMLIYVIFPLVGCYILASAFDTYALPSIFSSVSLASSGILITGLIPLEVMKPALDLLISIISWGFLPVFIIVIIILGLFGKFRWP